MKRPQEGGDVKETEVSSVEQPESACFPGLAPHHRKWVTHVQRAGRPWTGGPEWKLISFTSSFCLLWLSFPELCLGVKCRAVEEGRWMLQRCPTEHLMGAPGVRVKQNSDVVVVVVTGSCSSGCGRCGWSSTWVVPWGMGEGRRTGTGESSRTWEHNPESDLTAAPGFWNLGCLMGPIWKM